MPTQGWKRLIDGWPWFRGPGNYPIAAYSEFLPPPRLGRKPYGELDSLLFDDADPFGWRVSEYEEAFELLPGLEKLGKDVVQTLVHLTNGHYAQGISRGKLENNPYWPPELAKRTGKFPHERYLLLLPLSLSRTQDDKGRIRWTVFGGSEQGPARAFWRSFYSAPRKEWPIEQSLALMRQLLHDVFGEEQSGDGGLTPSLRILPLKEPLVEHWSEEPLPRWTKPFIWKKGESIRGVRYVLTFRPFGQLPESVQKAYLAGKLHLLPTPSSLIFWGTPPYLKMADELPLAMQIPLLHLFGRHEGPRDLRVPQSGWMHEPKPGQPDHDDKHGPIRNSFKRTHRWGKVHRHEDELALIEHEDELAHVLFSALPDDVGLYGKPMARNAQVWTHDARLLLDGPNATWPEIEKAVHATHEGGLFGYRFHYPPMVVGRHEVFWHRPLVAYWNPHVGQPVVMPDLLHGYLTAYDSPRRIAGRSVELWPRIQHREAHAAAIEQFCANHQHHPYQTTLNVKKLLDTRRLLGRRLPRSLAYQLLTTGKEHTLDTWLSDLPQKAKNADRGSEIVAEINNNLEAEDTPLPKSLTYDRTAKRAFEVNYWNNIAFLAEGKFLTKNNADCVRDHATQKKLCHHQRDLDVLGDYLLNYYTKVVAAAKMTGKALVGDLPFRWQTDFKYPWMGGWLGNEEGQNEERDLIVVIPGKDRSRAVIMGDHYDTAYMLDHYDPQYGGTGARLAAAGADDNHSATVALMLGAPVFLELSRQGKLACDIWLIHLTGEEFPADCLGARHLTQQLVEGTLKMRLRDGKFRDLSKTRAQGVYVLDMIAHNNDHDRDTFQIAPGASSASMWLAYQAHVAAEIWNRQTPIWNKRPSRRGKSRGHRSPNGNNIPETALHPSLYGEVRPPYDPRSTLYNTDGQIFSDAGVPVVLFMENYDINRTGYHDTHDTMENIDLDYGAAVAAITIEAVARAATEKP